MQFSWWVSPKRTRSYPYSRVYNTLGFGGKKITVIPIYKDEGSDGDRDFLQWDTISLMSLLGIYVIISYYNVALSNSNYKNKITNQKFDYSHIRKELQSLKNYHSDALHWNLNNIDNVPSLAQTALDSYEKISKQPNIKMHSKESALKRILELSKGKEAFLNFSRKLAEQAQYRESKTIQPKELLSATKATITIKNYLGGCYYFTVDEAVLENKTLYLKEAKHSKFKPIPSLDDIKDGLMKMIIFSNLSEATLNGERCKIIPVLKLTSAKKDDLSPNDKNIIKLLLEEAEQNGFQIESSFRLK